MSDAYDLIVIGGGLVGGAIAWGAASRGASVVVLGEGDVAYRAARGNFGLVWVQSTGAGMPAYAHWTRRCAELWPDLARALAATTGVDAAPARPGGLAFCLSDREYADRAAMLYRMHNESGDIGPRMLDRTEVRAMVPGLGRPRRGRVVCPIDGHANPLYLLRALHAALPASGGAWLPARKVAAIAAAPHSFTVDCGTERFTAAKLVIAAGLGSRALAPMVGLHMPVYPLQGQIVVTERLRPFLHYPTHVARQTAEGSVMLGDSQEDVGFDTSTKVAVLRDIATRNVAIFPALQEATIVRMWAALRVMSPDGFPIYAQSEQFPGAFAPTCHGGVTLAGAHALALAPAILAGELPETLTAFSSHRFAAAAA
jgi:glycine/D-amino acid oxidase-like deaminating enzyme